MKGWTRPYRERANSLQLKKDRLTAGPLWRPRAGSDNRTRKKDLNMASADLMPLVAGNWKMNGLAVSEGELTKIVNGAAGIKAALMVCPPATLIADFAAAARGSAIAIGGQDCHAEASGAHTGDIAAEMLKDAGAVAVIVGHSERRTDHHETDSQVRAKAIAARRAGLIAIVCIGEQRAEREAG